jgi:dTDP-4-amino-4,6-dideoxygalactose transaminase
MKQIKFTIPFICGKEIDNIKSLEISKKFAGDGEFTKLCSDYISNKFSVKKTLLTTSCTHALEMAALLIDIKEGDEVIMPSYTFVSTANAFVLRGAKIIFVDIDSNTLNIDLDSVERAITPKTKAIVPVHYAGISCDMVKMMELAKKHNIYVIEDAAQAINSKFGDKYLGTFGDFGCYSFHETKNIHCGEGGALLINNDDFINRAEIIREKGTDRSLFIKGVVDKYTWREKGSSYLMSELNAAFLYAQLQACDSLILSRLKLWNKYFEIFSKNKMNLNFDVLNCNELSIHNAHIFILILENKEMRDNLMMFLNSKGIQTTFHYIPLHTSPAGKVYGEFMGNDINTTNMSERILRLPLHNELDENDIEFISSTVLTFLNS